MKKTDRWNVDSGTTAHMTNKNQAIKNGIKKSVQIGVAEKNGSMRACDAGNMEFQECKLRNVMYTPDLSMNLLSVNAQRMMEHRMMEQ